MESLWPRGKWCKQTNVRGDCVCCLVIVVIFICGTWRSKEVGGLKLSYGGKGKDNKQEEL